MLNCRWTNPRRGPSFNFHGDQKQSCVAYHLRAHIGAGIKLGHIRTVFAGDFSTSRPFKLQILPKIPVILMVNLINLSIKHHSEIVPSIWTLYHCTARASPLIVMWHSRCYIIVILPEKEKNTHPLHVSPTKSKEENFADKTNIYRTLAPIFHFKIKTTIQFGLA